MKKNDIRLYPLSDRRHDLDLDILLDLEGDPTHLQEMLPVAQAITRARDLDRSVILFMGGHVIRSGVQNYLIDLMDQGAITGIAMNGACIIHDFELALIGATTENVKHYIRDGRFGMWQETGRINDIINEGFKKGLGIGEAMGEAICKGTEFPHKAFSIIGAAYQRNIPVTVHVGIGQDIIHQHPNFDGAATGGASHIDFLKLATQLENISQGVVMNFGSAVMAPEVYLKALSMARNVGRQQGKSLNRLTTLVCDLVPLPRDWKTGLSRKSDNYYFRPYKTMLVRTVENGGESHYVRGRHNQTIPGLWQALKEVGENDI